MNSDGMPRGAAVAEKVTGARWPARAVTVCGPSRGPSVQWARAWPRSSVNRATGVTLPDIKGLEMAHWTGTPRSGALCASVTVTVGIFVSSSPTSPICPSPSHGTSAAARAAVTSSSLVEDAAGSWHAAEATARHRTSAYRRGAAAGVRRRTRVTDMSMYGWGDVAHGGTGRSAGRWSPVQKELPVPSRRHLRRRIRSGPFRCSATDAQNRGVQAPPSRAPPRLCHACPSSCGASATRLRRGARHSVGRGDHAVAPHHRVDAPGAGAADGEVEEDEAVEHRQLALVHERDRAAGDVGLEVRHRHLAAEQEGHRAREQADRYEQAADQLQHAGEPDLRERRHRHPLGHAAVPAEELLPT